MARSISLPDLMERFHLSECQLKKEVSDDHLNKLSKVINGHEVIGPELGLKDIDLTDLSAAGSEFQKNRKMLNTWKQRFSFNATFKVLIEALLNCSKGQQATDVCRILTHCE